MSHDRRQFLRTVGAGCAGVLVAGCSESASEDGSTEADATEEETDTETTEIEATETESEETETSEEEGGEPAQGPRSAAHHDPDDGFAEMAPWLDDGATVVTVSEPTRAAVEEAIAETGPTVVVFETSGTIDLEGETLPIEVDRTFLAGQTAPSPGVTFVRGGVEINANDCVVQHLRFRAGTAGYERGDGWEPDSLNTDDETENNVVDHCSASWSIDEVLSVGYRSSDTTVSNCLIAEPLHDATHSKGAHGYGTLVGDNAENVALMGNVWSHAGHRNPRLKSGTLSVVVNNVVNQFDEATTLDDDTVSCVEGNVYLRVDEGDAVIEGGRVYYEDNVTDPETQIVNDVYNFVNRPRWPADMERMPASETLDHNLANAGARPADRTEHDERIVANVRTGEGGYIDSQEEVGGYPDLPVNTHELDVPETGLRAWLREQALAVETN